MIDIASIGLLMRWALVTAGLIYFVTESAIFSIPRMALARTNAWSLILFYCRACFGFWVGMGLGFAGLWPFGAHPWVESAFAAMALGAVWSHWVDNVAFHAESETMLREHGVEVLTREEYEARQGDDTEPEEPDDEAKES